MKNKLDTLWVEDERTRRRIAPKSKIFLDEHWNWTDVMKSTYHYVWLCVDKDKKEQTITVEVV